MISPDPQQGTFLFLKNNPAACPDTPTDNRNPPVFPKNNFIIKAHHPITPTIVCQRGPRDRTENRTKKGAGILNPPPAGKTGTVRLPGVQGRERARQNARFTARGPEDHGTRGKTAAHQNPRQYRGGLKRARQFRTPSQHKE